MELNWMSDIQVDYKNDLFHVESAEHRVDTDTGLLNCIEDDYNKPYFIDASPITWVTHDATIKDKGGNVIFSQEVTFPDFWSENAVKVTASKYFKEHGSYKENHLSQLIDRVVNTITDGGIRWGYFSQSEADIFKSDLTYILLHQKAAFNSPVWFNLGIEETPMVSACYINQVEDNMGSILNLAKTEGMLFKHGSGTGTNLSSIRSKMEKISGGGTASGPMSFLSIYDAVAGSIKSGGKHRRSAKMVMLDVGHPDILEFIDSKIVEEEKAHALIKAGYGGFFNGEAYQSVKEQNGKSSVRVTDDFMHSVELDRDFSTIGVTTGAPVNTYKAREIFNRISKSAWRCGDPGIQFTDTVTKYHTCSASGPIRSSNPCGEFIFIDNSACNLASINLGKITSTRELELVTSLLIIAQDILVSIGWYPTEQIARNSANFRPLGLGFADLGGYLIKNGLAYSSAEGRKEAARISAIITRQAYETSSYLADILGAFEGYSLNKESVVRVLRLHGIDLNKPIRNSQVTCLAPTGTISFMMDCATTGVEPCFSLVSYKKTVDGGFLKLINTAVEESLLVLGYSQDVINEVLEKNSVVGLIDPKLYPIFDCAMTDESGRRIQPKDHIDMMAAIQPFISGAISKTINCPETITESEIQDIYMYAWKSGLKSITIYRDNSKGTQPLSNKMDDDKETDDTLINIEVVPVRQKLEDNRLSIAHKFNISGAEGYLHIGVYENSWEPGEVFINMSKQGSTISGLLDGFATMLSLGLQYGVPLSQIVDKLVQTKFEPSGITSNPQIKFTSSIYDYVGRTLQKHFIDHVPFKNKSGSRISFDELSGDCAFEPEVPSVVETIEEHPVLSNESTGETCPSCGAMTFRSGTCNVCPNCYTQSSCA